MWAASGRASRTGPAVIDPRGQNRGETGFTLIEAMIAMGLFAIGSLMLIPAVFTWTYANNIGKQRQRATEILEATASQKRQESWSSWSSPVSKSTYSATLAAAQSCLGNQISSGSATCTSGDPVSFSCCLYFSITSLFSTTLNTTAIPP